MAWGAERALVSSGITWSAVSSCQKEQASTCSYSARLAWSWAIHLTSVAGYDDALSRVSCFNHRQPRSRGAEEPRNRPRYAPAAAVERLDRGRTEPRDVVLTPHLVVRATAETA
ncbi:hypothetical protein [Streptomyces sp. 2A115]|uniref:hypothetical protein n=1 Tax=Streptomyces sp. 2A115 TaxID=3457439 RepID=UPI003FD62C3D